MMMVELLVEEEDGGGAVDWERDVNEYNVTIIIDGTALTLSGSVFSEAFRLQRNNPSC